MSLADLILQCPSCQGEALAATGASVSCGDCGANYEYDPDTDRLFLRDPDGRMEEVRLSGGPAHVGRAPPRGGMVREAEATARFATVEVPVFKKGGLLGFVEQRGPHIPGVLRLFPDRLEFDEAAGTSHRWPLLDVRAVQTASSSVQISPLSGGVVTFSLRDDSPRRWEGLLRAAVSVEWKAAGRGTVVDFQPRIRAE